MQMPCPAGLQYLIYAQTTYKLHVNLEGLRPLLIFLERLFQKDYLGIRVNLFHGELSVPEEGTMYFLSLNYMRQNSS